MQRSRAKQQQERAIGISKCSACGTQASWVLKIKSHGGRIMGEAVEKNESETTVDRAKTLRADRAMITRGDVEWMTLREAIVFTGMSRRALQSHIAQGTLKPDSPSRPGFRLHRFRKSTLEAFLKPKPENENGKQ